MSKSSAKIRRIRDRIAAIERITERSDRGEQGQGHTYREDVDDNRAAFVFDGKSEKPVGDLMKRDGFVIQRDPFTGGTSAYVRKLMPAATNTAQWLQLDELLSGE